MGSSEGATRVLGHRIRRLGLALAFSVAGLSLTTGWFDPPQAQAETLDFDQVLNQALALSYDLKIAHVETNISKAGVIIARAEYFPNLRGYANTEYLRDLDSSDNGPVAVVGNTVLPSGTRFQNSLGVNLQQLVYDFGIRKRKVGIAQRDVEIKDETAEQLLRDFKVKLLDTYTQALIQYKSLKAKETLLPVYQKTYQMKERLFEAGVMSKIEVAEEAIAVAQTLDEIQVMTHQLQEELEKLAYYTQSQYDAKAIELLELSNEDSQLEQAAFDETQTPEHRIYQLEAEKKTKEIELLKRQYLPQLSLYSNYNLYGANPDHWADSVSDIQNRNLTTGLSLNIPMFDGFKTHGGIEKAKAELEKIRLERDKKIAELKYQVLSAQKQSQGSLGEMATKTTVLDHAKDKLLMVDRLSDQELLDKTVVLKELVAEIQKELELQKTQIQRAAALKKLKMLLEG